MSANKTSEENRIELLLSQEQKDTLEKAAALMGISIISYIISQSLDAAKKDIAARETLCLISPFTSW